MSTSLLEMNHIKKEFDGLQVLKDVSIHVNEGEVVSIIGSSGSGKSTLLRCATLLTLIDDGEVSYMGNKTVWTENGKVCLPNKTKLKEIQSCFGLVFQNFNLFPQYTALENVMLAKKLLAAEQPDFKERKREILTAIEVQAKVLLTQMGLDNRMDNYPHQLSGGQCQRVAIARALAKNPKLLLCDEPTGALDYQTGKAILKLLQDTCRQKGMTVVVITHNMAIAPMADQVIRFKNGQVRNITRNSEPTPVEQIEW